MTVTNKKRLPLPYINLKFQVNRAFRFEDGEKILWFLIILTEMIFFTDDVSESDQERYRLSVLKEVFIQLGVQIWFHRGCL